MPTPESIGALVKKYRVANNLNQEQLGRLAFDIPSSEPNKAQQRISKIEKARKKYPTIQDIYLIAAALRIKFDDLLKIE